MLTLKTVKYILDIIAFLCMKVSNKFNMTRGE